MIPSAGVTRGKYLDSDRAMQHDLGERPSPPQHFGCVLGEGGAIGRRQHDHIPPANKVAPDVDEIGRLGRDQPSIRGLVIHEGLVQVRDPNDSRARRQIDLEWVEERPRRRRRGTHDRSIVQLPEVVTERDVQLKRQRGTLYKARDNS